MTENITETKPRIPTTTTKPVIKSSQNGGAMEGWNDIPLLDTLLKSNSSSTSLSSKGRKRRIPSYVAIPAMGGAMSGMNRSVSQLSIGSGSPFATNGVPPPPPPPAPTQ